MRSALIAGVKKATTSPSALLGGILGAGRKKAPSFEDLPGFEAIRLQQRLAGKIGIPVPFYRLHEAKAGTDTVIDGRPCTNFTSYDYLGLNGHPLIVAAVSEAAAQWGTSVSASRLTSGERAVHRQLEGELASLYCAEDALLFVSGHATNVTTIGTMLGEGDLIIHDRFRTTASWWVRSFRVRIASTFRTMTSRLWTGFWGSCGVSSAIA
jgi:hypothetical protein